MALLEISNITVKFGGLTALSDFSLSMKSGDLVGLIGPNGAGKTTAFNVTTGIYSPTAGDITLAGHRIDGQLPYKINHAGLARTFQNIRLFSNLTVLDNVMVGFSNSAAHGLLGTFLRLPRFVNERTLLRAQSMELLETMGLADLHARPAGSLPYGGQRRLEIARALATRPKILLLDEPAAGMNPNEKIDLMHLIGFIRERFNVGIWLIEHDMKLVMSICQRITVLDHGQIISVGTPQQVQSDSKVINAYLGEPA